MLTGGTENASIAERILRRLSIMFPRCLQILQVGLKVGGKRRSEL